MISIGDEIKFRYNDLSMARTTFEWYDFKDEVLSHLGHCEDHKWFSIFGNDGVVVDILTPESKIIYIIKTKNFGEVTASIKMIKLLRKGNKVRFKIDKNYVINKV
jgi:hypothetical protein